MNNTKVWQAVLYEICQHNCYVIIIIICNRKCTCRWGHDS